MTDDELDKLDALAQAATRGPWRVWMSMDNTIDVCADLEALVPPLLGMYGRGGTRPTDGERRDADFIAASREAVPALVAEVRRLRRQVDEMARGVTPIVPFQAQNALPAASDQEG